MEPTPVRSSPARSAAFRLARRSWRLQYRDSPQSIALAERALAQALAMNDLAAQGWARLSRGIHWLRYATREQAEAELQAAQRTFAATGDRAGEILAVAGVARCHWLAGRSSEALALVQPLRDEALRVLAQDERGMVLNVIAGCHSTLGQSAQAFAYMYQALRETRAARYHGFDVVIYNNLAHELCQLGDTLEALRYIELAIERCQHVANPRILATLLANRVTCLTDLDRPRDALPDIERLLAMRADASGRGATGLQFETMAIPALRAGERQLGADLVERAAAALAQASTPDERIELRVARAELLRAGGDDEAAARHLQEALAFAPHESDDAPSLRARCLLLQALADAHERLGRPEQALRHLRDWQALHVQRAARASQARYQAASLQTELLRLTRERDEIDARRRASERAKADLQAMNRQLSQRVIEVQSLQAALREQAVRDFLTGLFNRRHLNDALPPMFALAERTHEPLAVAIVDLDHFKRVNDDHGHAAGDAVLAAFGALLAGHLRKSDVACRYGGEEFCVLMPRTDAEAAARKIMSLQETWRAIEHVFESGRLRGCTFSAGIADSRHAPLSVQMLMRAADAAVLQAKRRGRDRVEVFDPQGRDAVPPRHAARAGPGGD